MKPIVVPTDFSVSSENAIIFAANMASEINTSLHLIHVYQMPVGMIDNPVIVISPDELKKTTENSMQELKEKIQVKFSGLQIQSTSCLGDVVTEINEFTDSLDPLAVIVGIKDLTGLEKLLFGNTASSIIRHLKQPVITLPANVKYKATKNIVLATDLQKLDEVPVKKIIELVKALNATLHIVHIQTKNEDHSSARQQLANALEELQPHFETVTDENIIHGLQEYVTAHHIDMLLILPHKHNLYERLFFTLHAEGIVEKMPIPVISINTN